MEKLINEAIETAQLKRETNISFYYYNVSHADTLKIVFSRELDGSDKIVFFEYKHNGFWFTLVVSEEQKEKMFKILNDTPYREVEKEIFEEPILDYYEYYGVKTSNFY